MSHNIRVITFLLGLLLWYQPLPGYCETRNVVLIIVDGMHIANEVAASRYLSGADFCLSFHGWDYCAPVSSWDATTYNRYAWSAGALPFDPANFDPLTGYDPQQGGCYPQFLPATDYSYFLTQRATKSRDPAIPATDSASSATAFSTGTKTDRGNVAWAVGDQAGGELTTILELAQQAGLRTGVVTTVPFCHATPAGFSAHDTYRGNYHEIAREMLFEVQPNLVVGSGWPDPEGEFKYISETDWQALRLAGSYEVVEPRDGIEIAQLLQTGAQQALERGSGLFGIFDSNDGAADAITVLDTPGSPSFSIDQTKLTLAAATAPALDFLSADGQGFFLVLEQGDVDWANHDNNYAWAIGAMYDAHTTAQTVVDWLQQPGNTATLDNTLVVLVPDHSHFIRLAEPLGCGDLPARIPVETATTEPWAYHWDYPLAEVQYLSNSHTNELVMLYATGAGSGLFAAMEGLHYPCTMIIDNTQVHTVLLQWLGYGP